MLNPPAVDQFEIVDLPQGGHSLRSVVHGETFHPGIGPLAEARALHIEQSQLLERSRISKESFVIWDVGLGAAANALAAVDALRGLSVPAELYSFDISSAALEFALKHPEKLDYLQNHEPILRELLEKQAVRPHPGVAWSFKAGDFAFTLQDASIPSPHAIFYDPYSPTQNPGVWSLAVFSRLCARLQSDRPCLITSYSRSTAVRVTLLLAGFYVGLGKPLHQKAETTLASNRPELLTQLLGSEWLERVQRSTNAAPMRGDRYCLAPISEEDFAQLKKCAQFN